MSARVLVVDDVPANVKLLEAQLTAEYFEVATAYRGEQALEIVKNEPPDIVLLDVMMPGMDGFEVCRRLKGSPDTAHIPIVMVTALDQPADRVHGLEAGADDFLTKPVDELALMARVRSLVRLKMMTDELRMRQITGQSLGILDDPVVVGADDDQLKGHILVVEDRAPSARTIEETLGQRHEVKVESDVESALVQMRGADFDLFIVSLALEKADGLRLCSQIRSSERARNVPILALIQDNDTRKLARALEMGVNDYLVRPIDRNELTARVRTQLRRKRYADRLKQNLQLSLEMAITDQLTGLYNRRYLVSHLKTLLDNAVSTGKPMSFLILDIDFFKRVNDTYGHDVGDEVLAEFARRIALNTRGIDLACRYGGEEFVVAMPDTDLSFAYQIAERLRKDVEARPFWVSNASGGLQVTVSIGVTACEGASDTAEKLLKRADDALYRAKRDGRNRVVAAAA
ncbi:MAG: PleD family two-component system response regulator [Alphaproteobacteria bacterium]|nr:PleD family two-component system response regulator [Alphaproteobacteria bacterium]